MNTYLVITYPYMRVTNISDFSTLEEAKADYFDKLSYTLPDCLLIAKCLEIEVTFKEIED